MINLTFKPPSNNHTEALMNYLSKKIWSLYAAHFLSVLSNNFKNVYFTKNIYFISKFIQPFLHHHSDYFWVPRTYSYLSDSLLGSLKIYCKRFVFPYMKYKTPEHLIHWISQCVCVLKESSLALFEQRHRLYIYKSTSSESLQHRSPSKLSSWCFCI